MSGWHRAECHWWPTIADALTKPWPREAILMDLRWWDDQERSFNATGGKMGHKRPGRPALCARWGWTDRKARTVLADVESWMDPMLGDLRPERPTDVQPASNGRPASEAQVPEITTRGVQPASSPRPTDVPTRTDHPTPDHLAQDPDLQPSPIPDPLSDPTGPDREHAQEDPCPTTHDSSPPTTSSPAMTRTPSPSPAPATTSTGTATGQTTIPGLSSEIRSTSTAAEPCPASRSTSIPSGGEPQEIPAGAPKATRIPEWRVAFDLLMEHHRGGKLNPGTWETPIRGAMKTANCSPKELADAYVYVQRSPACEWWQRTFPDGGADLFKAFLRHDKRAGKDLQLAGFIEGGRAWRARQQPARVDLVASWDLVIEVAERRAMPSSLPEPVLATLRKVSGGTHFDALRQIANLDTRPAAHRAYLQHASAA